MGKKIRPKYYGLLLVVDIYKGLKLYSLRPRLCYHKSITVSNFVQQ